MLELKHAFQFVSAFFQHIHQDKNQHVHEQFHVISNNVYIIISIYLQLAKFSNDSHIHIISTKNFFSSWYASP